MRELLQARSAGPAAADPLRDRALAARFDHHLAKPVDSARLAALLAGLRAP